MFVIVSVIYHTLRVLTSEVFG